MMLVGGGMRVALATTHLALKDVARHITRAEPRAHAARAAARPRRALRDPAAAHLVAGLNPHAGESGFLGREEIDIISPVLERLRREGFDLDGAAARRHAVQPAAAQGLRLRARDVPRPGPAGAQVRELRRRRQRHARAAHHPHLGRPRHRARSRRHRPAPGSAACSRRSAGRHARRAASRRTRRTA